MRLPTIRSPGLFIPEGGQHPKTACDAAEKQDHGFGKSCGKLKRSVRGPSKGVI